MEMKEMMYKRKSVRSYTGEPVDEVTIQKIKEFTAGMRPLYPDIAIRSEIVSKESVKCILPWITPQLIAIFSEDKEGAMENAGFMFQQLELYMQSLGLGVCWLGMGKLDAQGSIEVESSDDLRFVILLTFGYPKGVAQRKDISEFKRKALAEISDKQDERLEPARIAPSSVNSQPWYFVHEGDVIHAYCALQGLFMAKVLKDINLIDMGIALAHLYIANADTFQFFKVDNTPEIKGHSYIGSFTL